MSLRGEKDDEGNVMDILVSYTLQEELFVLVGKVFDTRRACFESVVRLERIRAEALTTRS
ncbi:MAG: hypothetical protein HN855_03000 [Anaerolineae bacterium]|jgi:hypothetical protein|nr:hypothetical protein [Anaerolineae bacterium]